MGEKFSANLGLKVTTFVKRFNYSDTNYSKLHQNKFGSMMDSQLAQKQTMEVT